MKFERASPAANIDTVFLVDAIAFDLDPFDLGGDRYFRRRAADDLRWLANLDRSSARLVDICQRPGRLGIDDGKDSLIGVECRPEFMVPFDDDAVMGGIEAVFGKPDLFTRQRSAGLFKVGLGHGYGASRLREISFGNVECRLGLICQLLRGGSASHEFLPPLVGQPLFLEHCFGAFDIGR